MRIPHRALFVLIVLMTITISSAQRPNILWLTSEDNSADWLGCYGNPYARTPNIDGLAKEGFQYMNTFANTPVCAPQRSTWITGIYSISTGTHPMRSRNTIPHDSIQYYPDLLKEAGYFTANYEKTDFNIGGREDSDCWDNPNALDWKALKDNQPFFQVINFGKSHESAAFGDIDSTIHDPSHVDLPEYHPDVPGIRKNYAKYYDAIHAMDTDIGNALKNLEEQGLSENTIVIYVSDHGGVLPRSKRFMFRNGLHCPLILRIPERFKNLWPAVQPGTQIDRLVSFVDMPKTWVSIAGGRMPNYMQGSIFLGPQTEQEPEYHFAFRGRTDERLDNARALCDKQYLYIRNYMPYVPWMQRLEYLWRMKATQAWETELLAGRGNEIEARFHTPKEWTEELYDMKNDPDCVENLVNKPGFETIAKKMRQQLREKQERFFDSGLIPEMEMTRLAAEHQTTIFELVRNPELYDVPSLLDAADLALERKTSNLPKLREMLEDNTLGIRYWGTVGCFLLKDKEGALTSIEDESHEIRAMAAWTLIRTGESKRGMDCLRQLVEERSYALLIVLNIIDHLGDTGKDLAPAIRQLELKETHGNQYKYPLRMQEHLLERFGK